EAVDGPLAHSAPAEGQLEVAVGRPERIDASRGVQPPRERRGELAARELRQVEAREAEAQVVRAPARRLQRHVALRGDVAEVAAEVRVHRQVAELALA